MSDFIKVYGQPGGLWLAYTLNVARHRYEIVNEGGDVIETFAFEGDAQRYCEANTDTDR